MSYEINQEVGTNTLSKANSTSLTDQLNNVEDYNRNMVNLQKWQDWIHSKYEDNYANSAVLYVNNTLTLDSLSSVVALLYANRLNCVTPITDYLLGLDYSSGGSGSGSGGGGDPDCNSDDCNSDDCDCDCDCDCDECTSETLPCADEPDCDCIDDSWY